MDAEVAPVQGHELQQRAHRRETNRQMKNCYRCREDLPLTDFGLNNSMPDKLSPYCKPCTQTALARSRASVRARGLPINRNPKRKPNVMARIRTAIKDGARTREQIAVVTQADEDVVADAIAKLYSRGELDLEMLRRRIYRLAERTVAA